MANPKEELEGRQRGNARNMAGMRQRGEYQEYGWYEAAWGMQRKGSRKGGNVGNPGKMGGIGV